MRRGLSFPQLTALAMASAPLGATALLAGPAVTTAAAAPGRARAEPTAVTGPGSLSGVAAVSARDAWAVGDKQVGSTLRTLIEHWNGRAWRPVISPDPAGSDSLTSVAAISPASAWRRVPRAARYPLDLAGALGDLRRRRWSPRMAARRHSIQRMDNVGVIVGRPDRLGVNVWSG